VTEAVPIAAMLLSAVGGALLFHGLLVALADVLRALPAYVRARLHPARRRLNPLRIAAEDRSDPVEAPAVSARHRLAHAIERPWLWVALALLLGMLLADVLKSGAVVAVVLIAGLNVMGILNARRMRALVRDARDLIYQFANRYPFERSVSLTLPASAQAMRPADVRNALEQALYNVAIARPVDKAYEPLRRLGAPAMAQLADLLSRAQEIDTAVFLDTLADLAEQVRGQERIARKGRQDITLLSITQRVMQLLLAAALLVAGFMSPWRDYFLAGGNWVFFAAMALLGVAASWYVESETAHLEAGTL
jgi:hypothetical protein